MKTKTATIAAILIVAGLFFGAALANFWPEPTALADSGKDGSPEPTITATPTATAKPTDGVGDSGTIRWQDNDKIIAESFGKTKTTVETEADLASVELFQPDVNWAHFIRKDTQRVLMTTSSSELMSTRNQKVCPTGPTYNWAQEEAGVWMTVINTTSKDLLVNNGPGRWYKLAVNKSYTTEQGIFPQVWPTLYLHVDEEGKFPWEWDSICSVTSVTSR